MPSTTRASRRCQHCGAELAARTISYQGKEWFAGFEECPCQGAVAERERAEELEERCREESLRREREERATRAGIPPRFLSATHPRAREVAEAILSGRNVYVCGEVGTTKTTLASAAALMLLDSGRTVRMASMVAILDAIKAGFREGYDPLPTYERAGALVLDDLGKGRQTDFTLERLFVLADHRSANLLPTIVTTQYAPDELIGRLSSGGDEETAVAIVSRLRQDCLSIRLTGDDRRRPHG